MGDCGKKHDALCERGRCKHDGASWDKCPRACRCQCADHNAVRVHERKRIVQNLENIPAKHIYKVTIQKEDGSLQEIETVPLGAVIELVEDEDS